MQQLIGPSNVLVVGDELFMYYTCLKYRGHMPPLVSRKILARFGLRCSDDLSSNLGDRATVGSTRTRVRYAWRLCAETVRLAPD